MAALKLPESLRLMIQARLRAGVRAQTLLAGVCATGVAVSLLESACTGQVYVPVLAALARGAETRWHGLLWLAWYNLILILPLLCVLGASAAGAGGMRLASFSRRQTGWAKVLLAVVFLGLGWWLWPGVTWPPGAR